MKTDFTSPANKAVLHFHACSWLPNNMKATQKLMLAEVAVAALLMAGCAGGPYYGGGSYSGPYYGPGPFYDDGGVVVVTGGHHFYGNGFGHGGFRGGSGEQEFPCRFHIVRQPTTRVKMQNRFIGR